MEWYWVFSAIIGAFLILLALGVPVFLAFTIIDVVGIYLFWGGVEGVCQFIHSVFSSISSFVLLPVPLFILMGEIIGRSGIFNKAIESLDKWMGHVGGRLCLIAIAGATIFAALSGSAMGTTAMLAAMLMPEMEKRGYNRTFALGSCFSGALAMIIPPSALAVILATLADLSVGKVLIGGVLPGLVLSLL
ncbi:MAG: TRAP transporter large permease subunit, partial [candidate division WOR-3 bacterium]